MILKDNNIEFTSFLTNFKSTEDFHLTTWQHYSKCFHYTIEKLLNKGLTYDYAFNCMKMSLLFLIRHYLELCLKENLHSNNLSFEQTHDLKDLVKLFDDKKIHSSFEKIIELINFDSDDGTCFRYFINEVTKTPFFQNKSTVNILDVLKLINKVKSTYSFNINTLLENQTFSKKIKWSLTCHLEENTSLGQIKTEYDNSINLLIETLKEDNYSIERLYLPLLFLIRHSLELGLKINITEAQKIIDFRTKKRVKNIHSLKMLYNLFAGENGYLNQISLEGMSTDLKKEFEEYKLRFEELSNFIHDFDHNSYYFRFPFDAKGNNHFVNINRKQFISILKLYYLTDPFITFTNDMLIEQNLFKINTYPQQRI